MKHAFLIIAHNNWRQLKELIQMLDAEGHDIYVHIDKKSNDFKQSYFDGITKESQVHFYQKKKVYWGGYSQVQVELFLFEKAHEVGYDYYHLLSGADLPLKNNYEIDKFFEEHKGKEFIEYDENKLINDPEISRRARLYHFLQNYRRRYKQNWINEFFTFWERVSLVIQIVFRVNRVKHLDWTIKYGSSWVSITDALVAILLEQKDKIEKVFSYTNSADELFVQTIAYNLGFQDHIYHLPSGKTSNMRFIDWERGKNGNPYTFMSDDFESIKNSQCLFARKFNICVDEQIIELIKNKILS